MKLKFFILISFFFFLFSSIFLKNAQASGEDCSPWSCVCNNSDEVCIRTNLFGKYQCLPAKKEAYDCNPLLSPHGKGSCNECESDLNCTLVSFFGTYLCLPPGANPDDYTCNSWTNEPCKSQGETCTNISWGHWECSLSAVSKKICDGMPASCDECIKSQGVWTALGCIPTGNLNEFIGWVLGKLIFVVSGIAFLLMAFGAFQILTSSGNPEKMKAGSELITSALSGLILIILSVFLLKLIGVDILHIPGLGK